MYYLLLENHSYSYEIYEILTLYYPGEKTSVCEDISSVPDNSILIKSAVKISENRAYSECSMGSVCGGIYNESQRYAEEFEINGDLKKERIIFLFPAY
jgi:hypothetical protein